MPNKSGPKKPKASKPYVNPVLDQFLMPATAPLVGLCDRPTTSYVRRQKNVVEIRVPDNPTSDDTKLRVKFQPDPMNVLGVESTSSATQSNVLSTQGAFRPGNDVVFDKSRMLFDENTRTSSAPTALGYGALPLDTAPKVSIIRFSHSPITTFGVLTGQLGETLASDDFGVVDLGTNFAAQPGPTEVRTIASMFYDTLVSDSQDSQLVCEYSADGTSFTSGGSQTVTNPSFNEEYNFVSSLPAGTRYVRWSYSAGTNAACNRNLVQCTFSVRYDAPAPPSYDFQSVPDIKQMITTSSASRCCGAGLKVSYTANQFVSGGVAAGVRMAQSIAETVDLPWTFDQIVTKTGQYDGEAVKGLYGFWVTKGPTSRNFIGYGNQVEDPNVLVLSLEGLVAGQSYKVELDTIWECESNSLIMGAEPREDRSHLVDEAEDILSRRRQTFTENPLHEDIIKGIKRGAQWLYDHRGDILEAVGTGVKIASTVAPYIAPLLL